MPGLTIFIRFMQGLIEVNLSLPQQNRIPAPSEAPFKIIEDESGRPVLVAMQSRHSLKKLLFTGPNVFRMPWNFELLGATT